MAFVADAGCRRSERALTMPCPSQLECRSPFSSGSRLPELVSSQAKRLGQVFGVPSASPSREPASHAAMGAGELLRFSVLLPIFWQNGHTKKATATKTRLEKAAAELIQVHPRLETAHEAANEGDGWLHRTLNLNVAMEEHMAAWLFFWRWFFFLLSCCTESCCHFHEMRCALVLSLMLRFTHTFL